MRQREKPYIVEEFGKHGSIEDFLNLHSDSHTLDKITPLPQFRPHLGTSEDTFNGYNFLVVLKQKPYDSFQ